LHELLVLPRSGHGRFLLVLLHGRGAGPSSWLSQPFFDELRTLGARAPAVLLLDGGGHSYWHDRRDGRWERWCGAKRFPPVSRARTPARSGSAASQWVASVRSSSRRGNRFGSARSAPIRRRCGRAPPRTAPGAFDDPADFRRNDLLAAAKRQRSTAARSGSTRRKRSFRSADAVLAHRLRAQDEQLVFHVWPGGHNNAYWRAHIAQYLNFYAGACG